MRCPFLLIVVLSVVEKVMALSTWAWVHMLRNLSSSCIMAWRVEHRSLGGQRVYIEEMISVEQPIIETLPSLNYQGQ
jgi:hypothetical protein